MQLDARIEGGFHDIDIFSCTMEFVTPECPSKKTGGWQNCHLFSHLLQPGCIHHRFHEGWVRVDYVSHVGNFQAVSDGNCQFCNNI